MFGPEVFDRIPETYNPTQVDLARKNLAGVRTQLAKKSGDYTLRENEKRFNENNELVASNPKKRAPKPGGDKTQQKLKNLIGEYKVFKDGTKDEYGEVDTARVTALNKAYAKDKALVRKGEAPHFMDDLMGGEESPQETAPAKDSAEIVDRGVYNGRRVVKYSDGRIEYEDETSQLKSMH